MFVLLLSWGMLVDPQLCKKEEVIIRAHFRKWRIRFSVSYNITERCGKFCPLSIGVRNDPKHCQASFSFCITNFKIFIN